MFWHPWHSTFFLKFKLVNFSLELNPISASLLTYHQKQPPGVFLRKGVLGNSAKFTGKHLCQSLFFNKVAGLRLWDCGTGVFLWILRNFQEHLCYRALLDECFCIMSITGNILIYAVLFFWILLLTSQPVITCLKLTMETLEQGVEYVQS